MYVLQLVFVYAFLIISLLIYVLFSIQNDESSDLNLGFGDFESDFTHSGGHLSAENKDVIAIQSHSRSMHTGTSSLAASDLKSMIAGTKKVVFLFVFLYLIIFVVIIIIANKID